VLFAALIAGASAAPRVVVVVSDDVDAYTEPVQPFLDALGEPATVVDLHGRQSEGDALVARLKAEPPAVVFALGAKAAWSVHTGVPGVPLVYASVVDPARYDLVGHGVSGIASTVRPVNALAQVKTFLPDVRRIAVLRGPGISEAAAAELARAASDTGLDLRIVAADDPRHLRRALDSVADGVDAVWILPDRAILDSDAFRMLVDETRRRRLPMLVATENMVRAGGLFAVVPDPSGIGGQSADVVRGLLDGTRPETELAYPDQVRVALNLTTLELAQVGFDRHLLDFVDLVVE
jgi:putative ABC transport system substrate-binding protein